MVVIGWVMKKIMNMKELTWTFRRQIEDLEFVSDVNARCRGEKK